MINKRECPHEPATAQHELIRCQVRETLGALIRRAVLADAAFMISEQLAVRIADRQVFVQRIDDADVR